MLIIPAECARMLGTMKNAIVFVFLVLLGASAAHPMAARIIVDGLFGDWEDIPPAYTDAPGDQTSGQTDFGRIWIANDEDRLHICIEVGDEIDLQEDNRITLFLDTDNDASTGQPRHGIGAELGWTFGNRIGFFVAEGHSFDIRHDDIGIVTAPSVTSTRFEITIDRWAMPVGSYPIFEGDTLRLAMADSYGGDVIPDDGDSIVFTIDNSALEPIHPATLRRQEGSQIRFLTYNVLFDGIFDPEKRRSFDRILNAVIPDIIGFEEIYDFSAEETRDLVSGMLPAYEWYGAKAGPDIIAVSRYPITGTYPINGNGAFLIDLAEDHESELLLVVAHPPCCTNDTGRQLEIDAIMAFIRDAKAGSREPELIQDTPIVIVGDMNFVGDSRQPNTLITGEIVNTSTYGPWFSPDWDGSDLADALPRHTDSPMTYTWDDDGSSYWPGRLDYIVYSDAVLEIGNTFVLSTRELSEDTLATYSLREDDTPVASDHLPVVADFSIVPAAAVPAGESYISPNPAHDGRTSIVFGERFSGTSKQVTYYDIRGRVVYRQSAGPDAANIIWEGGNTDGRTVSPGIYFVVVKNTSVEEILKIVYLR
jgi:endonuclease/exonuclease/phosphatase family metal-dependent hydrolase